MKILYATGNPAKYAAMKRRLMPLGIELQSLTDLQEMGMEIPQVEENGTTPLENAQVKAKAYYEAFGIPVFSCDSGLYFEGEAGAEQPGVHVRTQNGIYLSDKQVQQRMIGFAKKYGELKAYYKHAICLVMDSDKVYSVMDETTESERFLITEQPHPMQKEGFPIDSLSKKIATGTYYYDLPAAEIDKLAVEDGVLRFFKKQMHLFSAHPMNE